MFKQITLLFVFIYLIFMVISTTNAISFLTILTSKRDDHRHAIHSSLNEVNGFKMKMKNILMRCEIMTENFLIQNKYSHIKNDLCLVYLIQTLMHVKRQRDQLEDYFTFRQG
jgi:hypothetical protein